MSSAEPADAPDAGAIGIAPMRWWHLEEVVELDRRLFGATAWSAESFWSELAAPDREYLVLAAGETVLGYAGLAWSGAEADVQTLGVSPALQGQGWGRALLDRMIDRARAHGATAMLLEVRVDNDPALRLYESVGFERVAVRRGYYQPGGVDAAVMRLRPLGPS